MKKFVAILLTLMLVLGVSAAVAEENYSDQSTVTIKKVYKLTNAGTTSPKETFTLVQTDSRVADGEAATAPALGTIKGADFAAGAATVNGTTGDITVELPDYEKVGVYEYTLKEKDDNHTAGVTYRTATIKLVVTVINGENGKLRVAAVHTESEGGTKSGTFENTYSAGTLNVSKTVTGNLGDKDKYFEFKVTLTGETGKTYGDSYAVSGGSNASNPATIAVNGGETTFLLKHGDTISIANLPYGVTYSVTETAADGYTTTKTGDTGSINAAETTAAFTNSKTGTIDTGVTTESLPYVVLMGFVVLAGAALLLKRKAHNN